MKSVLWLSVLAVLWLPGAVGVADEHQHGHSAGPPIERPRVFLDKSPRIVEYQLKRLDNARLLLVERDTSDRKYVPVYRAILLRPGMARQERAAAVEALQQLNGSTRVAELLNALQSLEPEEREQQTVARQLSELLLEGPADILQAEQSVLQQAAQSPAALVARAALAALMQTGQTEVVRQVALASPDATVTWLEAILLLKSADARAVCRPQVVPLLQGSSTRAVTAAAIRALGEIPVEQADTFQRLAGFVNDGTLRAVTIQSLLKLPVAARDSDTSRQIVQTLVTLAEATPPADRTTDDFVDALQLVDQLLVQLSPLEAAAIRERLQAVTVRVVRIKTVHEEMRYDLPYFVVAAGRPVQLVLQNEDLMPHNLVITLPGALQSVAEAGAVLGPSPGFQNLPFVPVSDQVLSATGMVEPGRQERLTFTAPTEPGEYPYVCTFPRHWMRMYGVMVVVEDPDAWQRNPVPPKDPLGNTRPFVRSWAITDFSEDLSVAVQGRAPETGARLFREATCAQCHRISGDGGAVGPELTDVAQRWKGSHAGVLREMLDPSWKVDPQYAVQVLVTTDGRTVSGIVKAEDEQTVSLLTNPENPVPVAIRRADIEERVPSAASLMPRGLLDKYTRDEVLEILHYLMSRSPAAAKAP